MQLIDTHCHLDEDAFSFDRAGVVDAAVAAGVTRIITIGTTAASSRAAVAIAEQFPHVYAAVGIQPNYTAQAQPDDWSIIEELAAHPRVVAVGETGLDRYWDYAPIDVQQDYFDRHIALSRRLGKPFIVHCREAETDVVAQLRRGAEHDPLSGVMHSFSGDQVTADACLKLGLYLSFAGMVTYKKNESLRAVAAVTPGDRILIETDAPYLAPTPNRGKRNEPAWVVHTARVLAEARGQTLDEFAAATSANSIRLFGMF
jgi:TatD DNase family protein